MKALLTAFAFLLWLAPATAQKLPQDAISTFFSEYVDDPSFDVVYVSGKVFSLFKDMDLNIDDVDDDEVKVVLEMVKDIQGIRVLHTEQRSRQLYEEARKRIPTDRYEPLFFVRTADGDNVSAYIQDSDKIINELFLLVGAEDSFVMLSFIGSIDLSKIGELQEIMKD